MAIEMPSNKNPWSGKRSDQGLRFIYFSAWRHQPDRVIAAFVSLLKMEWN
jgi:hypothetical protein